MKRYFCKFLLVCGSMGALSTSTASAIDPLVGLPYAWGLGAQYAFRNSLPTPPYFSIYPPVYYGARYQRPYGDSPYASYPLLGQIPGYTPVPKESYAIPPRAVENPYSTGCCSVSGNETGDREAGKVSVQVLAEQRSAGKPRIVVNPFSQEKIAKQ
ncbi:MAG: hypothetical protein FJ308_03610 [Planctomycetes bacterium]|nr:hypothetical protein [Planctomycetota bacterium]